MMKLGIGYRIAWFIVASAVVCYASYIIVGSVLFGRESGKDDPIVVRDEIRPGQHHLRGTINVASPCDQLSARTQEISSSTYMIFLTTWHEPSVRCEEELTPRTFNVELFAPATGVRIYALLDGVMLPIYLQSVLTKE